MFTKTIVVTVTEETDPNNVTVQALSVVLNDNGLVRKFKVQYNTDQRAEAAPSILAGAFAALGDKVLTDMGLNGEAAVQEKSLIIS
jgi:hypothetical protein